MDSSNNSYSWVEEQASKRAWSSSNNVGNKSHDARKVIMNTGFFKRTELEQMFS